MSTQAQANHIVPRSIPRHRPIVPETDQPEIPPWHHRSSSQTARSRRGRRASSPGSLAATVGCGMAIALVLIVLGQVAMSWARVTWDDWHYGRPRITQADAYVGHEQAGQPPSHFLVLNNRGRIELIEFPGDDATHARIFLGPQLSESDANLIPATLTVRDPHHTRYPDVVVDVGRLSIIFHNTHESFELQY